ncbi:hypothetical protein CAOG_09193 [Capsaspora owczarzaki ATCC 30864]|uniref:tRNA-splicing endonuclease subunit Sen15 domain-containing protein n=1 Tax=Capsaspora owczarzaki (strain ATCC 30864) TaxID=595528 RepID=A0A0D2W1S1_CAPO3|nr:hypothetical protein CAOG_09193 [Capsaspora owczarzaki ATCC 30864]KJE98287.1 hypothetical protein CAOG_009193 [Capsaspora owczarzaki ATCC 30864]|eukprot:XP_011270910.1 hypothetical protein CAOG_09193 [Capsaspora owczarzaki ATCC 30864]
MQFAHASRGASVADRVVDLVMNDLLYIKNWRDVQRYHHSGLDLPYALGRPAADAPLSPVVALHAAAPVSIDYVVQLFRGLGSGGCAAAAGAQSGSTNAPAIVATESAASSSKIYIAFVDADASIAYYVFSAGLETSVTDEHRWMRLDQA